MENSYVWKASSSLQMLAYNENIYRAISSSDNMNSFICKGNAHDDLYNLNIEFP